VGCITYVMHAATPFSGIKGTTLYGRGRNLEQIETAIGLWGCRVNHCGINLGLLFIADYSDGCRSHPCVRKASGLDQEARPVLPFFWSKL